MKDRTVQDLLAERRANVLESMRETDATAKSMLEAHIDEIDAELARRRTTVPTGADVRTAKDKTS